MKYNFIDEFVKSQEKKRLNKKYLKENNLYALDGKVYVAKDQLQNYRKSMIIQLDLIQEQREEINKLKKQISNQKGRITKQTNEQNKIEENLMQLKEDFDMLENQLMSD